MRTAGDKKQGQKLAGTENPVSKSLESGTSLVHGGHRKGVCLRAHVHLCGLAGADKEASPSLGHPGVQRAEGRGRGLAGGRETSREVAVVQRGEDSLLSSSPDMIPLRQLSRAST